MRPGRFHPGNVKLEGITGDDWDSFNEAGAFPPRKFVKERANFMACYKLQ